MAESFSRKGAFHLPIDIVEISEQNMLDLPLRDQPYDIIGKMKITYNGAWSYTEQLFDHPIHSCTQRTGSSRLSASVIPRSAMSRSVSFSASSAAHWSIPAR